jgi:hypothetical protein
MDDSPNSSLTHNIDALRQRREQEEANASGEERLARAIEAEITKLIEPVSEIAERMEVPGARAAEVKQRVHPEAVLDPIEGNACGGLKGCRQPPGRAARSLVGWISR